MLSLRRRTSGAVRSWCLRSASAAAPTSTGHAAYRTGRVPGLSPPRAPRGGAPFPASTRMSACATRASCSTPISSSAWPAITRRCSSLAARSGAHQHHLPLPVRAVRDRQVRLRSERYHLVLGPGEPPGLGDLRGRAAGHRRARAPSTATTPPWKTSVSTSAATSLTGSATRSRSRERAGGRRLHSAACGACGCAGRCSCSCSRLASWPTCSSAASRWQATR